MPHAMKDGIQFFISDNNVILTEGIDGLLPSKYFRKVYKKKGGVIMEREAMQIKVEIKHEGPNQ